MIMRAHELAGVKKELFRFSDTLQLFGYELAINSLVSNKRGWNNCLIKSSFNSECWDGLEIEANHFPA